MVRQFFTSSRTPSSVTPTAPARFTSCRLPHSARLSRLAFPITSHPTRLTLVTTGRCWSTRRRTTASVVYALSSLKSTTCQRVGSCATSYHPRQAWQARKEEQEYYVSIGKATPRAVFMSNVMQHARTQREREGERERERETPHTCAQRHRSLTLKKLNTFSRRLHDREFVSGSSEATVMSSSSLRADIC